MFSLLTALLFIQGEEEAALISKIPDLPSQDGHATDEEKLASTGQKPTDLEVKGEPEEDLEYFECSNVPVSTINHTFSSPVEGTEASLIIFSLSLLH